MTEILIGARIFDGVQFHEDSALVIERGVITALIPASAAGPQVRRVAGILAPAFVDLQVNGGGGHQISGATTLADLRRVCALHQSLGCAGILPTLITDTPEATRAVIAAGVAAARAQVPGFLGLHLEGPHLDPRRKGAHDAALIRPMGADDLALLCAAARDLPALMVTLAPEAVTSEQIARLAQAGAVVSLGHTDCTHDQAQAAFGAGARSATHLFNAMGQLGNRAPGLVGAVLAGKAAAGLIADGIHVHPSVLRIAAAARPEGLFVVTDCMAFAGTDLTTLALGGRLIRRTGGQLTLEDGTLAGADLTMMQALAVLTGAVGLPPERALAMTSRIPAEVIGMGDRLGRIAPGYPADIVLLASDWTLRARFEPQPASAGPQLPPAPFV